MVCLLVELITRGFIIRRKCVYLTEWTSSVPVTPLELLSPHLCSNVLELFFEPEEIWFSLLAKVYLRALLVCY